MLRTGFVQQLKYIQHLNLSHFTEYLSPRKADKQAATEWQHFRGDLLASIIVNARKALILLETISSDCLDIGLDGLNRFHACTLDLSN